LDRLRLHRTPKTGSRRAAHDVGNVSVLNDDSTAECQAIFEKIFFNPMICGGS